jgi:hypothetical protein
MHQTFHPVAALRYRPLQLKAVHGLLRRMLEDPDQLIAHLRQCISDQTLDTTRTSLITSLQNGWRNHHLYSLWCGCPTKG